MTRNNVYKIYIVIRKTTEDVIFNNIFFFVLNIDINKEDQFEDTKGVIRIRISKNRQHNGQKKKYKRRNNILQNIHIELKIE